MKKSLLFVAALLVSAMSFANIVINAETKNGNKGAFTSSYVNEERAFPVDEIEFGQVGCQYNAKETPKVGEEEKAAKQQFIQMRKFQEGGNPAGTIYNKEAIDLKTITILQFNEKEFQLAAGDAIDDLAEIAKPEAETVKETIKIVDGEDEADFEIELHKFVFDLSGKKFFQITNVDNNTIYLRSIVIDNSGSTAIDNAIIAPKAVKVIENGQLVIIRDGVRYNTVGQVIE
ncbi:MAG: hypothetical protein J5612_03175 [Paludibacteraceae bacterium]|nr:hypothetical protein [Paludibacteraceae bacterium]